MPETRLNLKHLLEDIDDSYPCTTEEAIVTELIANSLDSQAYHIVFSIDPDSKVVTIKDNGRGMNEEELASYHDIAESTRVRGQGIGFAGLGAKLSLLIADDVYTEVRQGDFCKATSWRLDGTRAPWDFTSSRNLLRNLAHGLAVSIKVSSNDSSLLEKDFLKKSIQNNFYALLHDEFMSKVLRRIYPNGINIRVDGSKIILPYEVYGTSKYFVVGTTRRPYGIGIVSRCDNELPDNQRGIAISTYGKVIKRGWDWLGVGIKNPSRVTGIVEIPQMSEILTTNKLDFLRDPTSIQKYYRYRKDILKKLTPILNKFGEIETPSEKPEKDFQPILKEIEKVVNSILGEFPELNPLMGRTKSEDKIETIVEVVTGIEEGVIRNDVGIDGGQSGRNDQGGGKYGEPEIETSPSIEIDIPPGVKVERIESRARRPRVMIDFENAENDDPGRLIGNIIYVNKNNPAFKRVLNSQTENYHIAISVAWVLSNSLGEGRSPQEFLSRFLSIWGNAR